jgi:hypothetical protein
MQSTNTVQRDLLLRQETPRPRMAKAKFLDLSIREKRAAYGAILKRASELAGFNRDQTADELKVDAAQLGRWWSGDENAQTWRYNHHPKLKLSLLVAQAEAHQQGNQVVVETVVRVMRTGTE